MLLGNCFCELFFGAFYRVLGAPMFGLRLVTEFVSSVKLLTSRFGSYHGSFVCFRGFLNSCHEMGTSFGLLKSGSAVCWNLHWNSSGGGCLFWSNMRIQFVASEGSLAIHEVSLDDVLLPYGNVESEGLGDHVKGISLRIVRSVNVAMLFGAKLSMNARMRGLTRTLYRTGFLPVGLRFLR